MNPINFVAQKSIAALELLCRNKWYTPVRRYKATKSRVIRVSGHRINETELINPQLSSEILQAESTSVLGLQLSAGKLSHALFTSSTCDKTKWTLSDFGITTIVDSNNNMDLLTLVNKTKAALSTVPLADASVLCPRGARHTSNPGPAELKALGQEHEMQGALQCLLRLRAPPLGAYTLHPKLVQTTVYRGPPGTAQVAHCKLLFSGDRFANLPHFSAAPQLMKSLFAQRPDATEAIAEALMVGVAFCGHLMWQKIESADAPVPPPSDHPRKET